MGTATGTNQVTDAQKAALLGWAGVDFQHMDFFLYEYLDGFWGKLLSSTNKTAKRNLIEQILKPALTAADPGFHGCLTEDFFTTIMNQDFVPQVSTPKKSHLGLGPLAFARRDLQVISDHANHNKYTNEATHVTATDLQHRRLDTPVPPDNPDECINLLQRMATAHIVLFTDRCKLAKEVTGIVDALRATLAVSYASQMNNAFQYDLGANTLWAVCQETIKFYRTYTTCANIGTRTYPTPNLSETARNITNGIPLQYINLPVIFARPNNKRQHSTVFNPQNQFDHNNNGNNFHPNNQYNNNNNQFSNNN